LALVGEHLVRLGDLLEPGLGLHVTRVAVGVQLARELPVRLAYVVGGGSLGHAKDLVEVLLQPVLRAHRLTSSPRWRRSPPAQLSPLGGSATATMAGRSSRSPSR